MGSAGDPITINTTIAYGMTVYVAIRFTDAAGNKSVVAAEVLTTSLPPDQGSSGAGGSGGGNGGGNGGSGNGACSAGGSMSLALMALLAPALAALARK